MERKEIDSFNSAKELVTDFFYNMYLELLFYKEMSLKQFVKNKNKVLKIVKEAQLSDEVDCSSDSDNILAYYNPENNKIVLCKEYFQLDSLNQMITMIHELFHYITGNTKGYILSNYIEEALAVNFSKLVLERKGISTKDLSYEGATNVVNYVLYLNMDKINNIINDYIFGNGNLIINSIEKAFMTQFEGIIDFNSDHYFYENDIHHFQTLNYEKSQQLFYECTKNKSNDLLRDYNRITNIKLFKNNPFLISMLEYQYIDEYLKQKDNDSDISALKKLKLGIENRELNNFNYINDHMYISYNMVEFIKEQIKLYGIDILDEIFEFIKPNLILPYLSNDIFDPIIKSNINQLSKVQKVLFYIDKYYVKTNNINLINDSLPLDFLVNNLNDYELKKLVYYDNIIYYCNYTIFNSLYEFLSRVNKLKYSDIEFIIKNFGDRLKAFMNLLSKTVIDPDEFEFPILLNYRSGPIYTLMFNWLNSPNCNVENFNIVEEIFPDIFVIWDYYFFKMAMDAGVFGEIDEERINPNYIKIK